MSVLLVVSSLQNDDLSRMNIPVITTATETNRANTRFCAMVFSLLKNQIVNFQ